jgi:hypothetical protein
MAGCHRDRGRIDPAAALASVGYPMGRWRLAPFDQVNQTVLWVSHIVVMYDGSNAGDPSFRPLDWRPDPPMPKRTDAKALSRALEVADLAARDPSKFADLARTYSDDVVTRDAGGSLGGVRAGQLPPEYRDALATMKPGETSRVVKTALGYSVLFRGPVPAERDVAGQRIVIRYQGTVGGARGEPSDRSRADALALARKAAGEAASEGASFDALVAQYSENADVVQGGDMGVWSLRDPGFSPREVEHLGQLEVGEVSAPVESILGFEILKRTEARDRPLYAMKSIELQYDPSLKDASEHSREGARRLAQDIAAQVHEDPSRFDSFRGKYCCGAATRWSLGRGPLGVTSALDALQIGEIAAQPIESHMAFIVAQRVDPGSVVPPQPRYELPAPEAPDLANMVETADGKVASAYTRMLADEMPKGLSMPEEKKSIVVRRVSELADTFQQAPDGAARVGALQGTLAGLKGEIGPDAYSVLDSFLKQWSMRLYLERGRPMRVPGLSLPGMPPPGMPARKPT